MPMRLNVGASRKVTDNNYGSRGAAIHFEVEVDSTLVAEPAKLQERVRQLFSLIRVSLAEELSGGGNGGGNGHGTASEPPVATAALTATAATAATAAARTSGNGSTRRPATPFQVKAILGIARRSSLDIGRLLKDRYQVEKPDDLSLKQASELIDSLNAERKKA